MTRARIEPDKYYSLQDIVTKNMFTWCAPSYWSVHNTVVIDQRNKNILKPIITGTGRATKYKFLGKNITNFKKLVKAGKANLI